MAKDPFHDDVQVVDHVSAGLVTEPAPELVNLCSGCKTQMWPLSTSEGVDHSRLRCPACGKVVSVLN